MLTSTIAPTSLPLPACPELALSRALAWPARPGTGRVLWLTGLSGVGKTALAARIYARLRSQGAPVAWLDGDALRRHFRLEGKLLNVSGRLKLAMRYATLASDLAQSGAWVVVSTISLFHDIHSKNRLLARETASSYLEVWLQAAESVRQTRAGDGGNGPRVGDAITAQFPLAPDLILRNDDSPATLNRLSRQVIQSWR